MTLFMPAGFRQRQKFVPASIQLLQTASRIYKRGARGMKSKHCFASALSSLMQQQQPDARLLEVQCRGWAYRLPSKLSSVQKLCDGTLQLPIELLERWVSDAVIDTCRLTCAKVKHASQ